MAFVELHARSAFSFLRGASHPEALTARAAELGMAKIAVTDRDGLYGTARVHYRAKEVGISGIVGSELPMEDGTVLPVLVRTRAGYQNLCRMLTRAKLGAAKGESRVPWSALEEYADGLFALSGDADGPVARAITAAQREAVLEVLDRLKRIFGAQHVAVEIQRHRLRSDQRRVRALRELAERTALPLVASNGAAYATKEGRLLLDAFTALRNHTTLDEAGLALAANSQCYLKGEREMLELFPDLSGAVHRSGIIGEMMEFTLGDLGYEFPRYDVPPGHDQDSYLREVALIGAKRRYGSVPPKVHEQIDKELALIKQLGFAGYFLVVWGTVDFCREQGILVQGRGSAANSTVCYCLGITNADPMVYHLLFERFLSEGRQGWPDIDLDLPSGDRRESVIQEVYRRFAPYGAAMTANVITYRGRSAMREMGKVLGMPEDVVTRFSSLFSHGDFPHTIELREHLKRAGVSGDHPRLAALIRLYSAVFGMPRHLGQHSGGMVLCTSGLDSIVPLEPASMPGRVVVQWDKDDCEDLGIIKVDLLGLGMMAVLEDTINLCRARGPEREIELNAIPAGDPATYEMIQKADTIGVFQIESRAQQATLPRLRPTCFYDIVISVAIIRPGPIVGKMVHPYLDRRAGRAEPDYMDDRLKPVLERTLGVPLFQEQVLEMAMVIGGFSGTEAEELRRALSYHRSPERMEKVMKKLYAAMTERNVPEPIQQRITSSISSFALYGFPQSHAISFALLAYSSAWLRAHRLAEMTAALLNNQPMGFYSSSTLVRDAKLHGLRVLPACVLQSEYACTVIDDHTIRLGLNQLRGLSSSSAQVVLAERARRPWVDMNDMLLRCNLPRNERRLMAKAGALNCLASDRRAALWEVERERQHDLFTLAAAQEAGNSPLLPMLPPERLQADYEATGLTVGPHPMALERHNLPDVTCARLLGSCRHGQRVIIAGMVICRQRPGTAKGHVFISLEDETGISNAFVPSSLFEARRLVVTQSPFLKIVGRLQVVDSVTTVCALTIEALPVGGQVSSVSHDFH